MLPPEYTGMRGRPSKNNRMMLNAMVWLMRSGASWKDLPVRFGPWKSVHSRYRRWQDSGVFQQVFEELGYDEEDMGELSMLSPAIRAQMTAAGSGNNGLYID